MKIGIIGGGQLARMLTQAALRLGHQVTVLEQNTDCPAAQVGASQIFGSIKDAEKIKELANQVDVVTIEIEHINLEAYKQIAQTTKVYPDPNVLEAIQDKYKQKIFLEKAGLSTARSISIDTIDDVERIYRELGNPLLIKAKYGAFDGRGNYLATSLDEAKVAFTEINTLNDSDESWAYAEAFVPFVRELAVMVIVGSREKNEVPVCFEVTETKHERSICVETTTPAEINENVRVRAWAITAKIAQAFDSIGTFGVEMFLTENGDLVVNEVAPRVHNSGHWTLDGAKISQFTAHIQAITGEKISRNGLIKPTCMVNILGTKDTDGDFNTNTNVKGVTIYNYGKRPGKLDRKMGHINAVAGTMELAMQNARTARKGIDI